MSTGNIRYWRQWQARQGGVVPSGDGQYTLAMAGCYCAYVKDKEAHGLIGGGHGLFVHSELGLIYDELNPRLQEGLHQMREKRAESVRLDRRWELI